MPKGQTDENLLVGFDTADDAAVYRVNSDTAIIQTVDFFPPMVDDPYTFGQVAAANALSDIYAMGGMPKLALNLLCFPSDRLPPEAVAAILAGGQDKVTEAGALLCGGHTVEDKEPKYGLAVTGFVHPDKVLTNAGAQAGDYLILTKALGSGILTTAGRAGLVDGDQYRALIDTMTTLNAAAAQAMDSFPVHACTDITGFGLIGHASEMASGSGGTIELWASELPFMLGAHQFASEFILPGGLVRNRTYMKQKARLAPDVPQPLADIMFDPQTSGGLLISVPQAEADSLMQALLVHYPDARMVGRVMNREDVDIRAVHTKS